MGCVRAGVGAETGRDSSDPNGVWLGDTGYTFRPKQAVWDESWEEPLKVLVWKEACCFTNII